MQLPLQITTRNVEVSEPEIALVRKAASALDDFAPRIRSCRVLIERVKRRGRTGHLYNVRIDLGLPGGEVVVRRQPREALLDAAQVAFQTAARRLQDFVRRQRGDVKLDRTAARGVVTRLPEGEGYGFLTAEDGRELYFDRKSVLNDAFDRLEVGMKVRFAELEGEGEQGPQASTVAVAGGQRRARLAR
ncbi:MAG TPA: HPF/RaiA family ribosome-associated protein [Gemmatimonadales bacterium]|nr:HPF/RaiA family ribosome-associated protein [Gemmatimonadales bacterium]